MKLTKKALFTSLICTAFALPVYFASNFVNRNEVNKVAAETGPKVSTILNTNEHFPTSSEKAWKDSLKPDSGIYLDGSNLVLFNTSVSLRVELPVDTQTTTNDGGYKCNINITDGPSVYFYFYYTDDVLSSITTDCSASVAQGNFSHFCIPEKVDEIPATCDTEGRKEYYKCDCGKCWEDSQKTTEISNFEEWENDTDGGYLPSFSHNILKLDSWNGNVLTITVGCGRDGCEYGGTKTVTATDDDYVMESPATLTEKEKGHYEIEISEGGDFDGVYTSNSFERGEVLPPLEPENNDEEVEPSDEGLSGGAIVGISIGAVAGVSLLTYIALFIAFVKTKKAPKFLIKSFEWILKLFRK